VRVVDVVFAGVVVCFLSACGGGGGGSSDLGERKIGSSEQTLTDVQAYKEGSRYASALVECVGHDEDYYVDAEGYLIEDAACPLSTLPFIAQESPSPTVNAIMDRVVVSHVWMGVRFQQLLERLPQDALALFGSVTAIVIDSDIRPSHYWMVTGAIYIDPDHLWLTEEEFETISSEPDFREDFGDELAFVHFSRVLDGGDYAAGFGWGEDRTIDNLELPFARLIYHELAHANDFMPPNQVAYAPRYLTPVDAILNVSQWASEKLDEQYPLMSQELFELADVLYYTGQPNSYQKGLSASYVGSLMENDGASHMYSYSWMFEDTAMLFQASMLKRFHNVEEQVAVLTPLNGDSPYCDDYIVGWGARNRIAHYRVEPRARLAANAILEDFAGWEEFFSSGIGSFSGMATNVDWCLSNQAYAASVASIESSERVDSRLIPESDRLPR